MKQKLAVDFADLVYNGKWFTPLREALTAFADEDPGARHRHREAQALQGQHHHRRHHLALSPCTPRNWSPSTRATTTRTTPRASSTCGACPTQVQALREQGKLNDRSRESYESWSICSRVVSRQVLTDVNTAFAAVKVFSVHVCEHGLDRREARSRDQGASGKVLRHASAMKRK